MLLVMTTTVFEKSASTHDDIVFGKVDTDAEPELSERFGIRSIPTLMAIRDGMIVFAEPGAVPEPVLENVIEQVRGLVRGGWREVQATVTSPAVRRAVGAQVVVGGHGTCQRPRFLRAPAILAQDEQPDGRIQLGDRRLETPQPAVEELQDVAL
jgi:hypothetical protein